MSGVAPKTAAKLAIATASAALSSRSSSGGGPPAQGGGERRDENDKREANKAQETQFSGPLPCADDPVALLTYQNSRLVQSIRQRQSEIAELRQRWEGVQNEIAERRSSTAVIRESWAELEESLRCISARVAATAGDEELKERAGQMLDFVRESVDGREEVEEGLTTDSRKRIREEMRQRRLEMSGVLESVVAAVLANERRNSKLIQSMSSWTAEDMYQKMKEEVEEVWTKR